jgi:beta-galactosidase
MKTLLKKMSVAAAMLCCTVLPSASPAQSSTPDIAAGRRERWLMDFGWRFTFGHATNPARDFNAAPASQMFSYFARAGTAVGAVSSDFDGRRWRILNLPRGWEVEARRVENSSGVGDAVILKQ